MNKMAYRHLQVLACGMSVALLAGLTGTTAAVPFTFTTIEVPGQKQTQAEGINAAGQIVGVGGTLAFIDTGGTICTISFPLSVVSGAFGINASGQIVGG
jgi:uncharacterized membrane protein